MVKGKIITTVQKTSGSALPIVLILMLIMATSVAAFLKYTAFEMNSTSRQNDSERAFYYAESGLQYGLHQLIRGWKISSFIDPFYYIDNESMTTMPHYGTMKQGTSEEGYFYTEVLAVNTPFKDGRDVTIKSTGMYSNRIRTITATYRLELEPSRVFDYLYFMNHWGWMQGFPSTFVINGNFRANGYVSFTNNHGYIAGHPEYERVNGSFTYKDSGGIYTPFRISGTSSINGMANLDANQHQNEDLDGDGILDAGEDHDGDGKLTIPISIQMPNIGDLTMYESHAEGWNNGSGSYIKIKGAGPGGTDLQICDAVLGDDPLEKKNLLLWGTDTNPIIISGPVVVYGGVIIKGKVTGKGCIYAADNIYIPDNLTYVNAPTTKPAWDYYSYSTPEERDAAWRAASQVWKLENANADGIGLLARGNIIVGDFKNNTWVGQVSSWLNNAANESAERANGLDHIPNTGDFGEGDSTWQVDYYTAQDQIDGIIPPGKTVGDVVAGSGEDIDGDGVMDGRINTNEFGFPDNIKAANWANWVPPETPWPASGMNWGTLLNVNGGTYMNQINAMLYTNHATVGYFGCGVDQTTISGGIVSRVEALVLGTGNGTWTHDERFTGGGEDFGFLLPRSKTNPELVSWRETTYDYGQED